MKIPALLAVATLALEGALAIPTIQHAHLHKLHLRDMLAKKDNWNVDTNSEEFKEVMKNVDWCITFPDNPDCLAKKPQSGGSTDKPVKTEEKHTEQAADTKKADDSSKEPKKSSGDKKSSGGSGKCLNVATHRKRATAGQDGYRGNSQGNIKPEPDCQSSGDYSITFINNRGEKKSYQIWNKVGSDGQAQSGMMSAPAELFELEDGQSATFTFEPNSQVGFSEVCGRAEKNGNVPNSNVGEANFNDHNFGNGAVGGSFYDVSMVTYNEIKAQGGSPVLVPMTISADGYSDSSCTACNYVNSAQNYPDDKSCKLGPDDASPFHIKATFG